MDVVFYLVIIFPALCLFYMVYPCVSDISPSEDYYYYFSFWQLEKQGPKSNEADLLKVARSFGTKVVSLEELLKELRKFKSLPISKENENAKERKQYKGETARSELDRPWWSVTILQIQAGIYTWGSCFFFP